MSIGESVAFTDQVLVKTNCKCCGGYRRIVRRLNDGTISQKTSTSCRDLVLANPKCQS